MNPAAPSRVRSVDCAKCLAIFCVLLIHAASDVLRGGPISSVRWLSGLFWGSVSRGAVPLFLLCSGALLLDAERTISARHIWRRNIPHMLLALFFWAAVYKAIGLLTAGQTDAAALRGALRDWLLWRHEGHLYYLPVILLCLLIPVENLTYDGNPTVKFLGEELPGGCCIHAATLVLAFCFWLAANLNAVAYAARDMNTTVLVTAAAAAAVLLVLALTAYLKLHKRPKVFFWCKVAFAAVLVVGAAGGVYAVSHMGGGLDPDQLTMTYPNGDSIWTFSFGYICRNIPATVKLLLRTLPEQGALWLQGLLGTTLGEPIVYRIDVSWLLGVGLLLAVLAAALPRQDEPALLGRRSKAGTAGICLCVVLAVLAAALNWTPINYQTLFGLQGRYLLPILPLALLLVKSSKKLVLRGDVSHAAALCTSILTMLTLLQGFGLYAAWQPVS